MPTPLPAREPGVIDLDAPPNGSEPGALPSGTSTRLEAADPNQSGVLEPGTIIAERYRIDALIGEGGMGKVYSAEHVHMRKQVAIKVLHPEMSTTPEIVARFEREAIAAGKITHPHVAAATDFGRLPNQSFFLVLEYVAGTDLRSVIRQGRVAPERALHIVRQIAAAVGAAHAAGVVHRDLKPENIMLVGRDGEPDFVKVLDFGIAKIETLGIAESADGAPSGPTASQPLTKLGAVFGTPDYMSPEQALGQAIDARSDLYSIGVMLYELLAGQRPFKGGAVTLMRKHVLEDAPPLPADLLETIDPRLEVIVHRLLQKSAQDRYASAGELGQTLDELLSRSVPEPAPPTVRGVSSAEFASLHTEPRELAAVPKKKRRSFGLALLAAVTVGAFALLGLGILSPRQVWANLWSRIAPALAGAAIPPVSLTPPPPISAEPAPGSSSTNVAPPSDTASAAPVDSASTGDVDDLTGAAPPDDSAAAANGSPLGAGAAGSSPRHPGMHVQARPTSKPIHKTNKPAPASQPKHTPFIPPPSPWVKN